MPPSPPWRDLRRGTGAGTLSSPSENSHTAMRASPSPQPLAKTRTESGECTKKPAARPALSRFLSVLSIESVFSVEVE